MFPIIARKEEQEVLELAYDSDEPEFIAVYGRRRVGKTYLIRNLFGAKSDCLFFYTTGIKDASIEKQLGTFNKELAQVFGFPESFTPKSNNWLEAFNGLTEAIRASKQKKIVLFFDEFPWMVTRKSQLLQALEYFWNRHWSLDARIKLIICGSASNWILKNIVNNRGGLYNRATEVLNVEPFKLQQAKEYLIAKKIELSNRDIVDLYMVLGGIPFYLDQVKPKLSVVQNIERLAFKKGSFLLKEFSNLYATLFGPNRPHSQVAQHIAHHCYGIGQAELFDLFENEKRGSWLLEVLEDLEQAGFIQRFSTFDQAKKGIFYKMIDEYSLFYFSWIEPLKERIERGEEKGYWAHIQNSSRWRSWTGCAFESVCNKHVPLIRSALNLTMAGPSQWRFVPKKGSKEQGAQIDLLFDREDRAITLCEIKYTQEPFVITKSYQSTLKKKIAVFQERTKTDKSLFFALISAHGLKKNIYSEELISGLVTLDDLFKEL